MPAVVQRREERSLTQWLAPLCLPMLMAIQPHMADLRTWVALAVLAFVVWLHYKRRRAGAKRSWLCGVERVCEKCERAGLAQLETQCRPQVGYTARSLRKVPWRILSRNWGKIAHTVFPHWVNVFLIWLYVKLFSVNISEAETADIGEYRSLGHFFSRRLRPGLRPVSQSGALVSPADGTVTHQGPFAGGFLQQVKGVHYSINYFLGVDGQDKLHAACDDVRDFLHHRDGSTSLFQWVVYLSPGDYHRFHSPTEWTVLRRRHFPGELLSVKPSMVNAFPGLFHVNERVAWLGKWRHGFFSLTAVGATNVGSIHAAFDPELRTDQPWALKSECSMASTCSRRTFHFHEKSFGADPVDLQRGQEFGHFEFGSTIVLIFEAPKGLQYATPMGRVRVGEMLA